MKHLTRLILALVLLASVPRAAHATVPSPTAWQQVVIGSTTQNIPVNFVFQNASDLLVLDSKASPPVTLVLNSDYSVAGGSGSTGSVTMIPGGTNAISIGDTITISRAVPLTQNTNFSASGPITGAMIMQALDKLTEVAQQLNLVGANSLQFQGDESMSGVLSKNNRLGMLLGFDQSGNLHFYAPQTTTTISTSGNYITITTYAALAAVATVPLPTPFAVDVLINNVPERWFLVAGAYPGGAGTLQPNDYNGSKYWVQLQ